MKTIFKPIKSIRLIPMDSQVDSHVPFRSIGMGGPRGNISFETPVETEKNDGPVCTNKQMIDYQENWNKVLPPKVIKQLKRTGDVMHGSYSVNMQMPEDFHREAHDIDIWAKNPSARATQMENTIDKCVGCDIAHVKKEVIGKTFPKIQTLGPPTREREEHPKNQFTRYTVITQPKNDVDVDYSSFPTDRPLKTRSLNGVRHETLDSALERAYGMQYRPLRAGRAREDIRRIEAFTATQKGKEKCEKKQH